VNRQVVFRTKGDRRAYLTQLREQSSIEGLTVLAYCLMTNHIHLVVVPHDGKVMARVLQRVHGRYAQYFNARTGRCGHLWQNRFSSCALSGGHLLSALRYVERNPVRAGMVERADDYEWSSAEAHLSGEDRWRVADMDFWRSFGGAQEWRRLLGQAEDREWLEQLRRATYAGQVLGDESFVEEMQRRREVLVSTAEPARHAEEVSVGAW
jgi:putative transposase